MIFIATGTQYPFDRLLNAIAAQSWPEGETLIAQTGDGSNFSHPNIQCMPKMTGQQFDNYIATARIVIAHAGMGTILSAISHGKPVICAPRKHAFGEHINDHQQDTLTELNHPLLIKCFDLQQLHEAISKAEQIGHVDAQNLQSPISQFVLETLQNC